MEPRNRAASSDRPQAPTITVDGSAIHRDAENDDISTPQTPNNDPNTLNVPIGKPRSDSWDSSKSTTTDVGSGDRLLGTKASSFRETQDANGDVFKPNPGEEYLFNIENNPFAFSPGQLGKLINPKNLAAFAALGGLKGLEKGLRTDRRAGLSSEEGYISGAITFEEAASASLPGGRSEKPTSSSHHEPSIREQQGSNKQPFSQRKRVFGDNRLPERKSKSLLQLAWIALQDHVLILLSVAAVVSLALGLYQTFGQTHHEGAKVEWVEGVAIIVAIAIVVIVGALNDWQKERQFRNLNRKKEDRLVKVVRSGNPTTISVHDVLVGDLMMLEPGDVIPVDGVFVEGHNLSCDESSATGESDLIKKVAADTVLQSILNKDAPKIRKSDPFIISGARVLDGVGSFLVTAVGQNSSHGRTMMSLREDPGLTPLQSKLNILAGYIAKIGGGAGCLLFIVLLIEFLARLPRNDGNSEEKGQQFLRILITSITIIVVAVPEGLPLAVTLSLAFATKKMTKENNLVRHLQSCETMGNATVICSDKTGTLTENIMTVVSGSLGKGAHFRFGDETLDADLKTNPVTSPEDLEKRTELQSTTPRQEETQRQDITIDDLPKKLNPEYQDLFRTAIAVNTTAFEAQENGKKAFVGTKTESALLDWARRCFALGPVAIERANHPLEQLFPFNSQRKCMGAVIALPHTHEDTGRARYRLFVKGAPEIVLTHCKDSLGDPTMVLSSLPLSESQRESTQRVIFSYATRSLRTLALAYRDFEEWPPHKPQKDDSVDGAGQVDFQDIFNHMTWMGVVGIQDPVRKGVIKAVEDCRTASVSVKMVTGDNVETARAIARECGIIRTTPDFKGLVMEGQEFRSLTEEERLAVVKDLCVLARSSPEDKRILVKTLRSLGEIVAGTGDGTNDAPALKAADVGFSMGVTGTEVAKEASDIILMDDNFSSIVKALGWGRAINDSVKKFLQFQLTVNITAVFITFISAVSDDEETSVLNAVQLLWVNLIMDTFAALALATDPPTGSLLHRAPEPRKAPLITITMWKMIIGQSIYQLIVCFVLWFAGPSFLGYPEPQLRTLIFNVFVFMQIFKLVNSRRIDNKLNIFEGLYRNHLFMLMMSIMLGGQIIIIYFGGDAFVVVKLTGPQWAISVVLGFFSIPMGVLIRLFPDSVIRNSVDNIEKHWPTWLRLPARKKEQPSLNVENYDIDAALLGIKDDLEFLRKIRGGRIGALSDALARSREAILRHRPGSTSRPRGRSRGASSLSSNRPPISPMRSVVGLPGIVAASVGGLSPVERHPPDAGL